MYDSLLKSQCDGEGICKCDGDFVQTNCLREYESINSVEQLNTCRNVPCVYHAMLYHTIPYYTILYHTIPYYTILYHTIPYYTILYHTIPYYTILYHTIPYYTLPNSLTVSTQLINVIHLMYFVLANVANCTIQHGPTTQGHPTSVCTQISSSNICSRDFETYYCDGGANSNYEVHILGSYQALSCCNDVPETSRIEVVNEGHAKRELVLVLASTRPVAWYLDMEDGMEIQRVVLVSDGYVQIKQPTRQR